MIKASMDRLKSRTREGMIWQGHYNSNSQEYFITSHRAPIVGKPFIKPTPTDRLLYQVCEYHYWLCAAYFQVGKLTRLMTCNVSLSLTAGAVLGVQVREGVERSIGNFPSILKDFLGMVFFMVLSINWKISC
jgi:hypothetical protein